MELRATHHYPSRRSTVLADNLVSTSHPLAAQAGLKMLACGGNAADVAIATAITLTLVEPTGNGLGSDAFAIIWDGAKLHGLNASGRSPAGWSPERFEGLGKMPFRGWESVTVPGAVSAWVAISKRFGKLPFADLFAPAIDYAQNGFIVTPKIAELWRRAAIELDAQPGFAETFLPDGAAPKAGDRFVNPNLAKTLRRIAETEGEAFYRGEIAQTIADFAAQHDAALSMADMAAPRAMFDRLPAWGQRASWAHQNSFEAFSLHAPAAILSLVAACETGPLPGLAIAAAFLQPGLRLLYIGAYVGNIPPLRSLCWASALMCTGVLYLEALKALLQAA